MIKEKMLSYIENLIEEVLTEWRGEVGLTLEGGDFLAFLTWLKNQVRNAKNDEELRRLLVTEVKDENLITFEVLVLTDFLLMLDE